MGYFDKITEATFKVGPEGETIFYPNGVLGKGRLVPNDDVRLQLFNDQKHLYQIALCAGLPYGIVIGQLGLFTFSSLAPVLLLVIYFLYKQHLMVKGLKKHHIRLGFKEAGQKGVQALPNWYFWLLGGISLALVPLAFVLPLESGRRFAEVWPLVAGIGGFGLFGLILAVGLYRLKISHKPQG